MGAGARPDIFGRPLLEPLRERAVLTLPGPSRGERRRAISILRRAYRTLGVARNRVGLGPLTTAGLAGACIGFGLALIPSSGFANTWAAGLRRQQCERDGPRLGGDQHRRRQPRQCGRIGHRRHRRRGERSG